MGAAPKAPCPRRAEEFLLLDPDFDVAEADKLELIAHSKEEAVAFSARAADFCAAHRIPPRECSLVGLRAEEMSCSIFNHGAAHSKGRHYVDLKVVAEAPDEILLRIRDDCPRFDPVERAQIVYGDDQSAGIGLRLIYRMATELSYVNVLNMNNLFVRVAVGRPHEDAQEG